MLIKFQTKNYPTIIMFDDIAKMMIKYMGQSGAVPSAINSKDVPIALDNLKNAINRASKEENLSFDVQGDEEEFISIATRAKPLIELLESARDNSEYVMWEKN